MKIRQGFVSNSSTTSFTCEACGDVIAYHDSCSLSDYGVITYQPCEHGVCECHHPNMDDEKTQKLWKVGTIDALKEELDQLEKTEPNQWYPKEEIDKKILAIKSILETEGTLEFDEFKESVNSIGEYEWSEFMPSTICPICSLEELNSDFIMEYVVAKHKLNLQEVHDEIKERFGTFEKFSEWLKAQNENP